MVSGSPVGSTPFGFDTPGSAPAAPTTGPALARYINPGSGDYELNTETGHFKTMPPLRQRVLLVVKTQFGSSTAKPNLGIERPAKIDQTIQARMKNNVRRAFYRLTDIEKVMRLDDITVTALSSGRIVVDITYTDLELLNRESTAFIV